MDYLQLSDGNIHYSRLGSYGDKCEHEADYCAACLLISDPLFSQIMTANKDSMDTIKNSGRKDRILYAFFSDEMTRLKVERPIPDTLRCFADF